MNIGYQGGQSDGVNMAHIGIETYWNDWERRFQQVLFGHGFQQASLIEQQYCSRWLRDWDKVSGAR
jgi:hypothetical protein